MAIDLSTVDLPKAIEVYMAWLNVHHKEPNGSVLALEGALIAECGIYPRLWAEIVPMIQPFIEHEEFIRLIRLNKIETLQDFQTIEWTVSTGGL